MTPMKKSIHSPEQKEMQTLLRGLRLDAGLSQSEMAARLGVPQSFVSKYESGERRLDILEVRQVCIALGVDLADFVRELETHLP
jgi:transcriptional regulator with XRE-family HTH domain